MTPEQAKELQQSILWTAFCKEIDKRINYNLTQLTVVDPDGLIAVQKQISVLNQVKNIPQDVIDAEEVDSAT